MLQARIIRRLLQTNQISSLSYIDMPSCISRSRSQVRRSRGRIIISNDMLTDSLASVLVGQSLIPSADNDRSLSSHFSPIYRTKRSLVRYASNIVLYYAEDVGVFQRSRMHFAHFDNAIQCRHLIVGV